MIICTTPLFEVKTSDLKIINTSKTRWFWLQIPVCFFRRKYFFKIFLKKHQCPNFQPHYSVFLAAKGSKEMFVSHMNTSSIFSLTVWCYLYRYLHMWPLVVDHTSQSIGSQYLKKWQRIQNVFYNARK